MEASRQRSHTLFLIPLLLLLVCLVSGTGAAALPADPPAIWGDQLTLTGTAFAAGSGIDVAIDAEGVTVAAAARSGSYVSPPLPAGQPFNVYVPVWEAVVPAGASLTFSARSRLADGPWTDWQHLAENHDWTLPTDSDTVGQMILVPVADGRHTALQFAVTLNQGLAAAPPRLTSFSFSVIDSTQGPAELVPAPGGQEEGGYPKPPVVGRDEWCQNPDCYYTDGLEYEPVTHLLVHHTVTSNCSSNCDWAATVRAIWYFHTYDRGWGDIGYNYLIDQDGVIYEGHLGGDDVVGTHAAGANAGSMGVALIGTFTEPDHGIPGIPPPQVMVDALVELFAWKADQRDIDVYDASGLPNLDWGVNHVAGHRDVYGTTTCPGDQAHDIVPGIRDAVAAALNFVPPHQYFDELSGIFTSSGGLWDGPGQCGFDVHAFYTNSTTGGATHWGRWQPELAQTGRYEVSVLAPYCRTGYGDTHGARYEVHHAEGVDTVVIDQGANLGFWQVLGTYEFEVGSSGYIYLTNQTTTDSNLGLWFDAVRFRFIDTTNVTALTPTADSWQLTPTVTFTWQYGDPAAVMSSVLTVATDANMNNAVHTAAFSGATQGHAYEFAGEYADLYWQVVATTFGQETVSTDPIHFGLDTQPPTSAVNAIHQLPDGRYVVNWSGTDTASGIVGYNIDMRAEGETEWTRLFTNTLAISFFFTAPDSGVDYWFRSQAVDAAGHLEPLHETGDLNTGGAPLLDHVIMFPVALVRP